MDDETLIAAYYACDNAALDTLARRYQARLIGFFVNGGLSLEQAEDAAQEVWARLMNTKHHLGSTAQPFDASLGVPFFGWLFTIARRLLADILTHLSHAPVQMPAPANGEESIEAEIAGHEEPIDTGLATEDVREAIRACMNDLPHNERLALALELRRCDSDPPILQPQWAQQHGFPARGYIAALNRARTRMRQCVQQRLGGQA